VEIPAALDIDALKGFSACFFKDKNHRKESPPHYYITIPSKQPSCLIICLVSSQLEKKIAYYKRSNEKCLNSLLTIEEADLDFLDRKSVIDCNNAEHIHKNALKNRVVSKTYNFIADDIPDDLKHKIIEAIRLSPKIKPYIKENIKYENKDAPQGTR